MTREDDKPTLVRKTVLVFDICSSTTILEDLKATDNLERWRNLLIGLKTFLAERSGSLDFEVYKFIGDGWILLFPPDISRESVLSFISDLMQTFYSQFDDGVSNLLQQTPEPLGITVGVDAGELIRLEMNEQIEYLGRALNVATRLQAATKSLAGATCNKALFSKNSFNSLRSGKEEFEVREVSVQLRNISNGTNYKCFEWNILF